MSYREENGQVILTMSREDYGELDSCLKLVAVFERELLKDSPIRERANDLRDRLNSGNPHYTPYETGNPGESRD